MRLLENKKDENICVEKFRKLITEDTMEYYFDTLDELLFEYMRFIVYDEDIHEGNHRFNQLWLLRSFINLFVMEDKI